MRKALIFAACMLIAWTIGALFSGLFQCDPIARAWNKELPGHCINSVVYFRAIASTNLITDVFILVLPVPIVWGLNRPMGERAALIGIFGLGTFVSIISIVRIVLLTPPDDPDPLWDGTQGTVWTAVETSIGVVCVNLPSMAPLFRRYILRHDIVTSSRSGGSSYPPARKPRYGTGSSSRYRGSLDSMNPLGTEQELPDSQREIYVIRDYNVTRDTNGHVELDEMASPTVNPPGETIAWHERAPTQKLSQEFAIWRP
ncbi:hypothetical protein N7510_001689 [Penicillium lagena]|uniref:uncharacterized protein n=1 Tax=Penicillium lagena TaxID=94218 RepID=UPI00253FB81E|nr:uncharacterized protein N7510_001689 [Penicillium lagena]KAJ5625380.1 hypothetical protein N7510_001689 [Penicillium lagena]